MGVERYSYGTKIDMLPGGQVRLRLATEPFSDNQDIDTVYVFPTETKELYERLKAAFENTRTESFEPWS